MLKIISLIIIIGLLFIACSGKDIQGNDITPPIKPELIQHLGDTGDIENDSLGVVIDTLNYHTSDGLENNGIDAVPAPPGSEKIKFQWEHLLDSDIDYIKIYRIWLEDVLAGNSATKIDSISSPNIDEYVDDFVDISPIDKTWFYYMIAFDTSGNSTISDTVCYNIIDSPALITPTSETTVTNIYDVLFNWGYDEFKTYRILFFDANYNLLWSYDLASNEDIPINYPQDAPSLESQTIYWRIDVFGQVQNEIINDKNYTVFSGSESEWRILYIQ